MQFDFRFFFVLGLMVVSGYFARKSFGRLWRNLRMGRAEKLTDRPLVRAGIVLKNIFGHKKMLKDFWPGLIHGILFFGFIIVTLGTAEHVVEGLFHGFSLAFLGPIYAGLGTLQDILQFMVVGCVLYFFYRRLISKPNRLPQSGPKHRDGLIVLSLTGGHMFADIAAFVFWILAGSEHGQGGHRPLSAGVASLIQQAGFVPTPAHAEQIAWIFWGIHIATVFIFLLYIPHSKHLHIITAGPNAYFARLKAKGTFTPVNFADETQTSYGVGKITQFSWKDTLDVYSCTQCGRCNVYCPTANTGKPLRPAKLIDDLKQHFLKVDELLAKDPNAELPEALISEQSGISFETVWACTTCRACVEACPVMIEHVDKIVDMRRHLVMMEGNMPAELQNTMKNWETQSNPWGMAPDSRDEWARDLNVARFADKPSAEYLFYVGCAGSFNDRNKKITTAFVKILQRAGVDFAILGKEELCNGETARRAGNEYLAKSMIDASIEVLKRYQVKKILTTCPHCFNTLKNEYPDFGFIAEEVIHHTDFINTLIKQGKVTPVNPNASADEPLRVAFHDSCYLGRYNEIYEQPREALRSVPGLEVIEMPRSKEKGLCCGAGGARMWMEEKIGKRVNVERTEEALALKPQVIAAGCPYCQVMITDGVNEKAASEEVKVMDLAEIIANNLG